MDQPDAAVPAQSSSNDAPDRVLESEQLVCPECWSADVCRHWVDDVLEYGTEQDRVDLPVLIPVLTCQGCGAQYTNYEAENLRERAVQQHLAHATQLREVQTKLDMLIRNQESLFQRAAARGYVNVTTAIEAAPLLVHPFRALGPASSPTSQEDRDERWVLSRVASCTCMTKTPELAYHAATCRYRVLTELLETNIRCDAVCSAPHAIESTTPVTDALRAAGLSEEEISRIHAEARELRKKISAPRIAAD
jgi:hypothetical protein